MKLIYEWLKRLLRTVTTFFSLVFGSSAETGSLRDVFKSGRARAKSKSRRRKKHGSKKYSPSSKSADPGHVHLAVGDGDDDYDDGYDEDVESSSLLSPGLDGAEGDDEEDDDLYRMHRPHLQDRFGTLRFRLEFSAKRHLLLVTVIDAWDLPPMDSNGKADPYVEVSLRPGHKKYTTGIKSNCLNPTFNETAELALKVEEIEGKELVLKVMDSDYPLQDELIGIIRLPLSSLDLSFSARQYSCLILHDKEKNGQLLSHADAAKLNLKISQQSEEIYRLEVKLRDTEDKLQRLQEEHSELWSQKIELEMDNFRYESEATATAASASASACGQACGQGRSEEANGGPGAAGAMVTANLLGMECEPNNLLCVQSPAPHSAPTSKKTSPTLVRSCGGQALTAAAAEAKAKDEKSYELLRHLQSTLTEKDKEIARLRAYLREVKPRLELLSSRNGQIEVGLAFFHITSRLRLDLVSAHNLRSVNLLADHSDPFAKVKVFRQRPGGKIERWKFETRTVWKTVNPVWNQNFLLPVDVTEDDLAHMHLEICVLDKGRLRSAQPLGKIRIGPNQTSDCQHWEEMIKHHGTIVKMTHALKDV